MPLGFCVIIACIFLAAFVDFFIQGSSNGTLVGAVEGNSESSLGKPSKLREGFRRILGSARVCGRQSTLNCTDLQMFVNDHLILDVTMWFRMYSLPGL